MFIEVTDYNTNTPVLINTKHIAHVIPVGDRSYITENDGTTTLTVENYATVAGKVKEA